LIALYDGEIRDFDHHLRLLIKALKSRHLYESSLIVLTADHGEEFYDHGAWLHAHSLFRELIQVPLIIKLPRNEHAGLKIAGQCSSVDILPTVFDLAGLPIWKGVQGSSLATIIRSEQSTWQGWPAFSEVKLRGVRLKAFLKDQKKLLFIELDKKKYWFLYDLQKDPGEKNSIFESHPEEAKKIMAEMAQFEKKNTEQRFTAKRTRAPDELKENLRELGYIE
jgi:choline-sulfatase